MPSHKVQFLRSCNTLKGLPDSNFPEIALIGRSNVGKSTLLNRLVGRHRIARTSKQPGCTRLLNYFIVDDSFFLVDLPGYGYARVPLQMRKNWGELITLYLQQRTRLRGSVLLVDSRHPQMDSDREMASFLRAIGKPYIVTLTKSDKIKRSKRAEVLRNAGDLGPSIAVSGTSGEGIGKLWQWIDSTVAG